MWYMFTNMIFTVMDGAGVIFESDVTEYGPNLGYVRFEILSTLGAPQLRL